MPTRVTACKLAVAEDGPQPVVLSSPTLAVEFGQLPRTPASGLGKSGRTANGKENSGGSLHKRFFNTLRGRSRSPKCNSEDDSPTAKPVRRRKSIVDLLNLSSRNSHDDKNARGPAESPSKDGNTGKDTHTNLLSDVPKRRRSLGTLLSPTNILGTVTNRVSRKPSTTHVPFNKNSIRIVRAEKILEHINSKDEDEKVVVHIEDIPKPSIHGKGPLHLKLAEGSEADIDLFESRLTRILEGESSSRSVHGNCCSHIAGIATEDTKITDTVNSNNSYSQLSKEACDRVSDEDESCEEDEFISYLPNSLRTLLSRARIEEKKPSEARTIVPSNTSMEKFEIQLEEEPHPRTPDSYLQLLMDSCCVPVQDGQPRSRSLSISEGSIFSYYHDPNDVIIPRQENCGEVEPSSMLPCTIPYLHAHQYEVRKVTPNPQIDKELSRQNLLDSRPILTVREVSGTSTLLDIDPDFSQRQAERSARYTSLGLVDRPGWKHDLAEIDRSIALTVAKMTRNYHGTTDEPSVDIREKETVRLDDEKAFNIRCCGSRFEFDLDEAWDSVTTGKGLMLLLQDESCEKRGTAKSKGAALRTMPSNEVSLLDFDDLYTLTGSSISERDHASCASAGDPTIPSIEEILLDSFVIRSPLDPFYASWSYDKLGFPLDLDQEIDFCPEYERFLRRTRGVVDPTPSLFLEHKTGSVSRFEAVGMKLPRIRKSNDIGSCTVEVRYPGTVNLLQHTECFSSMRDAIRGLCDYKLGDLATFFVYDEENRTIDAHSIDSPVPNPAKLKEKGLQLCWIPRMFNMTGEETMDDASTTSCSPYHLSRHSVESDSVSEELISQMNFVDQFVTFRHDQRKRPDLPSIDLSHATSDGPSSIFGDDSFLADQSSSELLGEAPITDHSSDLEALRAIAKEEDVLFDFYFEGDVPPTKTWIDLAREQKALSLLQDQSVDDEDVKCPWQDRALATASFEKPVAWPGEAHKEPMMMKNKLTSIVDGYDFYDSDGIFDSLESSLFSKSSSADFRDQFENNAHSNELDISADVRCTNSLSSLHSQAPVTRLCKNNSFNNSLDSAEQPEEDQEYGPRPNSIYPEPDMGHSPGYHFTAVREHMMSEGTEDAGRSSDDTEEHDTNSMDHAGVNTDFSLYDEDAAAVHLDIPAKPIASEDKWCDLVEIVRTNLQNASPLYDEDAAAVHLDMTAKSNAAEDKWNDLVEIVKTNLQNASLQNKNLQNENLLPTEVLNKGVLEETDPNDSKHPVLESTTERINSYSAMKDLEQAFVPEGEVTLMQLNLRPIGRAARSSPPAKKGKSKVGALVNIFQDYGLMPEKSRGTLPMPSISPSFSPRASRYRGEPSGTSVGSGTVRGISLTLSIDSLSIPSPINRAGSPYSTFERSLSRLSDLDTEVSLQFGETLKRTAKHGESEDEDLSAGGAELYG
ncbi:hypothetical protein VTL71DRAFT_16371 [Oculimacula yallundae]|uniref:Uncharacterized protein n=1 Tax=Oculimacula yallundae TaxID=86028 RepID=A0ABR4CGI7_9HELO